MKLNYYLRPSRTKFKPVKLSVSINGERDFLSSGIYLEVNQWNKKEKCVKQSVFDAEGIQKKLNEFKKKVSDIAKENQTLADIKIALRGNEVKVKKGVLEMYEAYIKDGETRISEITGKVLSKGTIKNYWKSYNRLKMFSEKYMSDFTFRSFDFDFENSYRAFFITELKVDPLTYGDYIKQLQAFLRWAKKKGCKPNKQFKEFYRTRKQAIPKALRKEELLSLYDINLKSDPVLERDLYIFLLLCSSAMRKGDYDQFNPSIHIEVITLNGKEVQYINIGAIKNNQECIVPYFDDLYFRPVWLVETMLSKYGKLPKIKDGVKFNKNIREVFTLAGITRVEPTSKMGRKTWASVKRKLGMSREMIRKVTGHREDSSLSNYIGVEPQDILQESLNVMVPAI
jgi:integrase